MSDAGSIWKPLPWDTAFFGVKTARIILTRLENDILERALAECREWGAQVVYYLADSNHDSSVLLAEQAGFHLVDVRVTLEWRPPDRGTREPPLVSDGWILRDSHADDLPALQTIARTSYYHSRYYYDWHYPRERCDALYMEWIAQSCNGNAERVMVAERNHTVVGYVTCHFSPSEQAGQIGLVGIHADTRGLGIGLLLIQSAQAWFREQGSQSVSVVTQGRNIAAQRLYQSCGFMTSNVQLWYHKWVDEQLSPEEMTNEY